MNMYLVQYILIIIENKIQICIDTIFFQNISLFLPEKHLDFLVTSIVFITFPFFLIVIVLCCGSISFIFNGLIVLGLCWFRLTDAGKCLTVALVLAIF